MTFFCTYCSAEKNYSETPIPAIDLYNSARIKDIRAKAKEAEAGFVILSGKYGLLKPEQRIPYYDYLLLPQEVEGHSELVASQLEKLNPATLVFYSHTIEKDPNLKAYIDCIQKAAEKSGVELELIEIG